MKYFLPVLDSFFIILLSYLFFDSFVSSVPQFIVLTGIILTVTMLTFYIKELYKTDYFTPKNFYILFESVMTATGLLCIIGLLFLISPAVYMFIAFYAIFTFTLLTIVRIVATLWRTAKKPKNVLIVGAGQDGKLIAEEIQQRPELKLNVVGFLDDNMNSIEDEDSTIPILGLTCDSEAVIKDNNVKLVIIAVKSRMDSNILTDLVRGIPLGVKVWRMYRFYEKITHKYLVSKMSVNWLFYDCVRKKALLYASLKRFCDIISSIAILVLTLPISLVAILGIQLSDLGPVFFTQMRAGKFGKPFKMIKFRIMYQDEVEEDFDDDVTEVSTDDKRMMPFGKFLKKFHIDELPQMINVLRGEMSIVGPRPVREEVYYENKKNIPFWECRNWVHPGWCGWQQIKTNDPSAEDRVGYDLYYIKHRHILWELAIFLRFVCRAVTGRADSGK